MSSYYAKAIEKLAQGGRERLKGAMLFGEPIDPDNNIHLLAIIDVMKFEYDWRSKALVNLFETNNGA